MIGIRVRTFVERVFGVPVDGTVVNVNHKKKWVRVRFYYGGMEWDQKFPIDHEFIQPSGGGVELFRLTDLEKK